MSALAMPFTFEGRSVRVLEQSGTPWWVLSDVCAVLEISKHRDAAARLDDDERGSVLVDTLGGVQETVAVNESGLWSLVLTSRKPQAKRFKKWITSEVIPAIRKTGGYIVAQVSETPAQIIARALQVAQAQIEHHELELERIAPQAAGYARLTESPGLLTLTEGAKVCGVPPSRFMDMLHREGWIYRTSGKKRWLGYAAKEKAGLLRHLLFEMRDVDGHPTEHTRVKLTGAGIARIATRLASGEWVA